MSFESLNDQRIELLLRMPKRVTNPKAREVSDANHLKRDYTVKSEDGIEDFANQYFTDQLQVKARSFFDALKALKNKLYSE